MDWLKFIIFVVTFVTSYGLTENSKQFGNRVNSPISTSTETRYKRFIDFSNTGPGQYELDVPPFLNTWLDRPDVASYLREIAKNVNIGNVIITNDEEETTDDSDDVTSEENYLPCKYGSSENPFPVPNIIKTGRRVSDIKCEKYMWHLKYRILDAENNRKQCNRLRRISLVIGGMKSPEGEFPHMGAVGWRANNNDIIFKCGATLISSRFSLSAGHCYSLPSQYLSSTSGGIRDRSPKIVRFGSVNIEQKNGKYAIDMIIDAFIVPSEFSAKPHFKYNDVGLIRFKEKVQFSEFVRPACLWSGSLDQFSTGIITGWGGTLDVMTSTSSQLQHAEVDFINKDVCQEFIEWRRSRLWKQGLMDYQFCAGKLKGGVDTCQGDSGGPIQIRQPLPMDSGASMYYVVGITNFGIGCGEPNLPGVYTNVSQFLNWIETTVWNDKSNKDYHHYQKSNKDNHHYHHHHHHHRHQNHHHNHHH